MLGSLSYTSTEHWLALASGALTHILIFRHGEWDILAGYACNLYSSCFVLLSALFLFGGSSILGGTFEAAFLFALHFLGLAVSMLVYRRFFHRLSVFPGPVLASLSSWYLISLCFPDLHQSSKIQELHRRYGDYVRIAPNKISITDAAATKLLYGSASTTVKGPFYSIAHPRQTMQMTRDNTLHDERRRLWDLGFKTQGLRNYVPTISKHTNILLDVLRKNSSGTLETSSIIGMLTFDAMFELGFGKAYHQLETGKPDSYIATVRGMVLLLGVLFHSPWLLQVLNQIPGSARSYHKFISHGLRWVDERLQETGERPDFLNFLVDHYRKHTNGTSEDYEMLVGDANLLMLAGSDTTATTLSCALYFLALNPRYIALIRDEASSNTSSKEQLQLYGTPHLDAVINETMRLKPLMPTGSERVTPPQGLTIGKTYLPGDTIVLMPSYTTFRDSRYFHYAEEFLPERWTTRPDLNIDTSVYIPFSKGKFNCAGKNLAMMEMRSVLASVCAEFDWELSAKHAESIFERTCRDGAVLRAGNLHLNFKPRAETKAD